MDVKDLTKPIKYRLAQINIAQGKDAIDTDAMKGFVNRLDEINAIADSADGFIWRLQTDDGDATTIQAFDDPNLLVNMSVWENIESLKNYVYRTFHVELIQDRDAWFDKIVSVHQTMWWIPEDHIPSIKEGKQKLEYLQKHGSSQQAFTFAKPFDAIEATHNQNGT